MEDPLSLFAITTATALHVAILFAATWRHEVRVLQALGPLTLFLIVLSWALAHGDVWDAWMREDAWVEWASFYAFAAAGALFAWQGIKGAGVARLAGLGLGVFCLFVAGEELSWGQRILAFTPPDVFLEENYQQELNLHNLIQNQSIGAIALESRVLVALIALVYGVLGAALPLIPKLGKRLTPLSPSPTLIPAWGIVIWMEWDYPAHLSGEAAEALMGLTFLADAGLRGDLGARSPALFAAAIGLGAVTPPLLDAAIYGSDETRVATAREELEALSADLEDAITRELGRKGRVHKRVFTAAQAGYLDFEPPGRFLGEQDTPADEAAPEVRNDRRGYFLDPWSNPYWILSVDGGDDVWLYSFGPNRRRDTDTKPMEAFAGDDVGVRVR